jgi:hypothetical protein
MAGTREDALLVVELAKHAAMLGIADATGKIFSDDFDPARAELGDPAVRIVLGFNGLHAAELAEPVETSSGTGLNRNPRRWRGHPVDTDESAVDGPLMRPDPRARTAIHRRFDVFGSGRRR